MMQGRISRRPSVSSVPTFLGGAYGSTPILMYGTHDDPDIPAVIVLQEHLGITEEVKQVAERISKEGYLVFVPAICRGNKAIPGTVATMGVGTTGGGGEGGEEQPAEHSHVTDVDWTDAVSDVDHMIMTLRGLNPTRPVGILGFCVGGELALASAMLCSSRPTCIATFYATSRQVDVSAIAVPVLAHFGEKDITEGFSDPTTVEQLEKTWKSNGVNYLIHRHPTQGHAYMNESEASRCQKDTMSGVSFDRQAVEEAWERVFAFFRHHLKGERMPASSTSSSSSSSASSQAIAV